MTTRLAAGRPATRGIAALCMIALAMGALAMATLLASRATASEGTISTTATRAAVAAAATTAPRAAARVQTPTERSDARRRRPLPRPAGIAVPPLRYASSVPAACAGLWCRPLIALMLGIGF